MTVYEERLQHDRDHIARCLDGIYQRVTAAVRQAVDAVVADDKRLANRTILGDRAINNGIKQIDRLCHAFVVRHQPSAGHLRWVSSVLRVNVALERVGDYAVNVCRELVKLRARGPSRVVRDIDVLGRQVERILEQSIHAFGGRSADLARTTIALAEGADDSFSMAFHDLIAEAEGNGHPVKDLFALLVVLRSLKRVSDQAENVCEQTLFVVEGDTQERKTFRIQFVDARNDCLSQLAEAYARKAFSEHGHFYSGGWTPADAIRPDVLAFMDRHGLGAREARPKPLRVRDQDNRHFHVIIGLEGDPRPHLEKVPFRTALLEWDLGPTPVPDADAELEAAYRRIADDVQALMELLVGPGND